MQQLPSLPLRNGLQQHLRQAQEKINHSPSYYKKVKQAKVLWQSKKKANAHKSAFNRIEKALQQEGSHCHYCEGVLGSSIEHFYPRGFYPNLTFVWENYLWSCQTCNTQYKGAQFALFAAPNSAKVVPLVKDRSFTPPTSQDSVCLNPRVDNALDYWQLDFETGHYVIKKDTSPRAQARAHYTLELLQLNGRSNLVQGRQKAYKNYQSLLDACTQVQAPSSASYIKELLPKKQASFYKQPLAQQQAFAQQFLHQQFLLLPFRGVWRNMQQQAALQPLFEKAPQAFHW
ncbi:MAG: retron system putative HNH endonuclease [Aureispira sp.]